MCRRAVLEGEWSEELDHGVEAVVLLRSDDYVLVTSDAEHRGETSAECSYYVVVEVPCPDTEGVLRIHGVPRVRSLESGEVEKALVDDCKGIGHRLPVLLLHLYREFLGRTQHIRHGDDRLEVGSLVVDGYRPDAVQTYREIVVDPLVRLYERDVDVEIRSHLRSYLESVRDIGVGRSLDPFAGYDFPGILKGYKGVSLGSGRNIYSHLLAYVVGILVGGEGQHRKAVRV